MYRGFNSIVFNYIQMANSSEGHSLGKRKTDDIAVDEYGDGNADVISGGPITKRAKMGSKDVRWSIDTEIPNGRPRPKFIGESEDRKAGSGKVKDPLIIWLSKVPVDAEARRANHAIARRAALKIGSITHVYIRCGTQSSRFVDRDGKSIHIWNPDIISFQHRTAVADPHISLAFGTDADNLVLYGYVNVAIDERGNPVDFATTRDKDIVIDGDDRIFELFEYRADEQDCAPYCPNHASREALLDACQVSRPKRCPLHETEGLLDHWCRRTRWKTEVYGDHFCHCPHDLAGLLDHYCPCQHDQWRRIQVLTHCLHEVPGKAKDTHYCPSNPL
ncbi:hypothetical protein GGR54DRAFT_620046 [Hypoxylon sp. NC1633]|nr:hypothetical protein GGR54DRAFT_620046 [Hypoxylon sp. NC1633]